MYDGRLRVQETKRERRLLPVDQWGTESGVEVGCGSKKSISSRCGTFGFFIVEDTHESWFEHAPQAPPGP